jgi:hypothetical protein
MNERATEVYGYMHAMMGALSAMSEDEEEELKKEVMGQRKGAE